MLYLSVWKICLAIFVLWILTSPELLEGGAYNLLLNFGQLAGLLATFGALLRFLLLGRIPWIEPPFGLDKITRFHRLTGYATLSAILLHPFLIIAAYTSAGRNSFFAQ